MADQKRWFKVWTSIISDDDFDPSRPCGLVSLGRFSILGAYTALHGRGGIVNIMPDTLFRITQAQSLDELRSDLALKNVTFEESKNCNGKITVTWYHWHAFQVEESSTSRVRRWREKNRKCNEAEERRREERRREEKRREKKEGMQGGTRSSAQAPIRRAVSYPEDFGVSEQVRKWAETEDLSDPLTLLPAFKDYHVAKGSRFIDWDAALRTWVRNDRRFNRNRREEVVDPSAAIWDMKCEMVNGVLCQKIDGKWLPLNP